MNMSLVKFDMHSIPTCIYQVRLTDARLELIYLHVAWIAINNKYSEHILAASSYLNSYYS